jgi:hypothetical protein
MSARTRTTRRHFAKQIAAALGLATLCTHSRAYGYLAIANHDLDAAIGQLISRPESAAIIGKAYLDMFDEERSTEVLARELRKTLCSDREMIDTTALLSKIRSDFTEGNLVRIHGWLLSRTEARLCALRARDLLV